MREDQRGFILNGIALLLILPALLLAGTCVKLAEFGGETIALQSMGDAVFYAGNDLKRVLQLSWEENLFFDNLENADRWFTSLAENYAVTTGLSVSITTQWYLRTHAYKTGQDLYAGSSHCRIARISENTWVYYFDIEWPDWNEPIISVTKDGDNLVITLDQYHFPTTDNASDIYFSDNLLWDNVIDADPRIGESITIPNTITQLHVTATISDSRGAVQYSTTVDLG